MSTEKKSPVTIKIEEGRINRHEQVTVSYAPVKAPELNISVTRPYKVEAKGEVEGTFNYSVHMGNGKKMTEKKGLKIPGMALLDALKAAYRAWQGATCLFRPLPSPVRRRKPSFPGLSIRIWTSTSPALFRALTEELKLFI